MQPFRCVKCSNITETDALDPLCGRCGAAVLLADGAGPSVSRGELDDLPPGVWRYRAFLPDAAFGESVTLGEGGTPLLRAERLGDELGLSNLLIKDESRNPTGSFMDRGSTVLLSLAKERRAKECTCVTTGNLGASLAAYCAKAGIRARIRVNPNTDQGKLYQMLAYGAEVEASSGPAARRRDANRLWVSAANPYLLEGEKTTGFEVVQELGWKAPDAIVVPVGTGGHLSMIWRSITQLRRAGLADASECRLLAVQVGKNVTKAAGGRASVQAAQVPLAELEESEPFFRDEAAKAVKESGGATIETTTADMVNATTLLARTEGIFAEPSSASVVAALSGAVRRGYVRRSETVVCVVTGAGLKDTKAVSRLARETRRVAFGEPYAMPTPRIGQTKLALLHLLQTRPSYGYELRNRLGPEKRLSTASVYQHLAELEDLMMVRRRVSVVAKGRERIPYELTRRGSDFLRIAGRLERAGRSVPS
ncbi:MAG: pyridoxal-phosphate dependent enzyme [Thaumarchaeota archaeon]|nr:pyridoxal-phosphate dependent enzyme [Nitrososphaerota archaeon]